MLDFGCSARSGARAACGNRFTHYLRREPRQTSLSGDSPSYESGISTTTSNMCAAHNPAALGCVCAQWTVL